MMEDIREEWLITEIMNMWLVQRIMKNEEI
jgi:hypothetical protein